MANLYEISERWLTALDNMPVDEETGEVDTDELDRIECELDDKLENVAVYIKECKAMAEAIRAEELSLAQRRKRFEKRAEDLEEYLAINMLRVGRKRFESPKAKISFRKSESVMIYDEAAVPDEFKTEKVTVQISKNAVKAAIGLGIEVPGAEVMERDNIKIK